MFDFNSIVCGCFDLLVIFLLLRSYACYFFEVELPKLRLLRKKRHREKVIEWVVVEVVAVITNCKTQDCFFVFFFCQVMCRRLLVVSLIPSIRGC